MGLALTRMLAGAHTHARWRSHACSLTLARMLAGARTHARMHARWRSHACSLTLADSGVENRRVGNHNRSATQLPHQRYTPLPRLPFPPTLSMDAGNLLEKRGLHSWSDVKRNVSNHQLDLTRVVLDKLANLPRSTSGERLLGILKQ